MTDTKTERSAKKTRKLARKAELIVTRYSAAAGIAGAVPVPVVDILAITGIQLKMTSDLAELYNIEYEENIGRSLITSLLASIGVTTIARGLFGSALKAIPGIGTILGSVTMPFFSGAATFAVGQLFTKHFEEGGTLLDFEPEDFKNAMKDAYAEGQKIIEELIASVKEAGADISSDPKEDAANPSDNRGSQADTPEENAESTK